MNDYQSLNSFFNIRSINFHTQFEFHVKCFTDNGRPDDWSDALEEKEESEGVGELIEAEEVDEYDAGEAHVGPARHSEHSAVKSLLNQGY